MGGYRRISSPISSLRIIQQKLNQVLQLVFQPNEHVHGFAKSRSIVSNANYHCKNKPFCVLNIDLADFFPSINFGRVYGLFRSKPFGFNRKINSLLANICCYQNQLPQGAPTSPIISNMVCMDLDEEFGLFCKGLSVNYSRYADDLSFSTSNHELPEDIVKNLGNGNLFLGEKLRRIIFSNGFRINPKKVRFITQIRRMEVTGLTINEFPNVKRDFIKSVRAMLHAWEKFGYTAAQLHFYNYDTKSRNLWEKYPRFAKVVKGKIEYIGMVRGRDIRIYTELKKQYNNLSKRDEQEILTSERIPILPNLMLESEEEEIKEDTYDEVLDLTYLEDLFEDNQSSEGGINIGKGISLDNNSLYPEDSPEKGELSKDSTNHEHDQYTEQSKNIEVGQDRFFDAEPITDFLSNQLIIQVDQINKKRYRASVYKSPVTLGEAIETVPLPFLEAQLSVLLKYITSTPINPSTLTPSEINILNSLKLLNNGVLILNRKDIVGERIFHSLFSGEIAKILYQSLNQLRFNKKPIELQLRFSERDTLLMRVPWELMYDGEPLLINGAISLSRYIINSSPPPVFPAPKNLRILFIESRPKGLKPLLKENFEFNVLHEELKELIDSKKVVLQKLSPPSFSKLEAILEEFKPNILHFDGHGGFLRECPYCQTYNSIRNNSCHNPACKCTISDVVPSSCLAFEDGELGGLDFIKSEQLSTILHKSNIKIAILSACRSGTMGETVYSSVGPALIRTGIPVVIAMQLPIYANHAKAFVQGFYQSLLTSQSISDAVYKGRRKIFTTPSGGDWFIPVLLWRSQ
jgi:RNA-directed DNA polymerase